LGKILVGRLADGLRQDGDGVHDILSLVAHLFDLKGVNKSLAAWTPKTGSKLFRGL